ncbi:MAG: hypothetical protein U0L04_00935, partial [Bacteroidaceae bacterium]|nr:hypothetical protein [Bacteroidaceae bacterium]
STLCRGLQGTSQHEYRQQALLFHHIFVLPDLYTRGNSVQVYANLMQGCQYCKFKGILIAILRHFPSESAQ